MKPYSFLLPLFCLLVTFIGRAQFSSANDYYAAGKKAQAAKNYVLAMANFNKAISNDYNMAEAWYELGRCNTEIKRYQSARENFQRCIEVSTTQGSSGGVVHDRNCECGGNGYLECPDCDIFGYEQLYYPENKKVLCRTCGGNRKVQCTYGKYVAGRSAQFKQYGVDSYRELGHVYSAEEDFENAVSYYDKYIKATGNSNVESDAWYHKGFAENALEKYTDAEYSLNWGLSVDSTDASLYLERAYTYRKMEYPRDAIADYRTAMKLDPAFKFSAVAGIGDVYYYELNNYDTAIIQYEKALLIKKDATVYYKLGYCYEEKERFNDAIRVIKAGIVLDPSSNDHHVLLGYAYYGLKQYDAALAQYIPVMKNDPQHETVRYDAGLAYAKKGDQKNLKKMIDELTALNATDSAQKLTELLK